MIWNKMFLSTIPKHQDLRGTQELQRKRLQDAGSIILVVSFPITSAVDNRSCPCPQRELQSSLAYFSLVFCELRSRKHGRNKENRIPYFYMRVLKPGGGNAGSTDLTLPLRLLPCPKRTGQGLKDETKKNRPWKNNGRKPKHIANFTISYN